MDSTLLARTLGAALRGPVRLVWTENRRVYLSAGKTTEGWTVHLDRAFRDAPVGVLEGVLRFLSSGGRNHLAPARRFFEAHRVASRCRREVARPRGRVYDLEEILAEVRPQPLFAELEPVAISWGPRVRPGRSQVRLGSYRAASAGEPPRVATIRVHPVLDDVRVPRVVVAHVVHHEFVHHYLTEVSGPLQGRRHGAPFQRLEKLFPGYAEATRWQRERLFELTRAVRRERKGVACTAAS